MPYDSLRPYLDRLEKENLVRWIDREVDKDWEISAIGRMPRIAIPMAWPTMVASRIPVSETRCIPYFSCRCAQP